MSVRPLVLIGDPILRTPCRPVEQFDDQLAGLVTDLLDTVLVPGRAGLAAPQIGVDLRAFSYNLDGRHGYLINPEIVSLDGDYPGPEACLSVPGVQAEVPRAMHAVAVGVDRHRAPVRLEGSGEFARCIQHEVDHLDGHVYLDRLSGDERKAALRRLREAMARER